MAAAEAVREERSAGASEPGTAGAPRAARQRPRFIEGSIVRIFMKNFL